MITHEIIQQMERELKSNLEQLMLAKHETRNERIVALFHSYTRKIVESVAEEIITCDPYADLKLSEEMQGGRFKLRQEQRIKKKEILSNLK